MDESNQVLSHQVDVVNLLAKYFDKITVLTGQIGTHNVESNVSVISSNWLPGKRFYSVFKFLKVFININRNRRFSVIFSHMTLVQSFLILPIVKILRIKHFLWYAHTKNSMYLKIVRIFSSGIITSTTGSCPLQGKKIFAIGQSIDTRKFMSNEQIKFPIRKLIHIGRFDPSKNVEMIIKAVANNRRFYPDLCLEILGSPSNGRFKIFSDYIVNKYEKEVNSGWLKFTEKVSRDKVPEILKSKDCFIHSFQGSLDKTLLEATMMGLPVVTNNHEYKKIFGNWSSHSDITNSKLLEEELSALLKFPKELLNEQINARRKKVVIDHNSEDWAIKLAKIILN